MSIPKTIFETIDGNVIDVSYIRRVGPVRTNPYNSSYGISYEVHFEGNDGDYITVEKFCKLPEELLGTLQEDKYKKREALIEDTKKRVETDKNNLILFWKSWKEYKLEIEQKKIDNKG